MAVLTRTAPLPKAPSRRGLGQRGALSPALARRLFSYLERLRALSDDRAPNDLDRRIADAKAAEAVRTGQAPAQPAKGYNQGSRVLAEMIGAPLGGGVIGWALDHWLGTSPWFLLGLVILAFVVAGRNIYRISKERAE